MSLVSAMCLGADCIDDCDLLRVGQTRQVLGHEVAAPSTLGTFCARSPSGMSVSSAACWPRLWSGHGRRERARVTVGWWSTSTADSGFWNAKIMNRLQHAGWTYSIGIRLQPQIKAAIAAIPERDWTVLEDYPERGEAQIAETTLGQRRLGQTQDPGNSLRSGPPTTTSRRLQLAHPARRRHQLAPPPPSPRAQPRPATPRPNPATPRPNPAPRNGGLRLRKPTRWTVVRLRLRRAVATVEHQPLEIVRIRNVPAEKGPECRLTRNAPTSDRLS